MSIQIDVQFGDNQVVYANDKEHLKYVTQRECVKEGVCR